LRPPRRAPSPDAQRGVAPRVEDASLTKGGKNLRWRSFGGLGRSMQHHLSIEWPHGRDSSAALPKLARASRTRVISLPPPARARSFRAALRVWQFRLELGRADRAP